MDTNHTAQQARVQVLKSAVKSTMDKKIQQQWIQEWRDCDKGRNLYKLASRSIKSMLRLHDDLSKRLSAIAVQLRTAKIDLQAFLYSRKQVVSSMCSCMRSKQMIEHVIFQCSKLKRLCRGLWFDEIRKAKWEELKPKNVLIDFVGLKKAAKLVRETELIGYLKAQSEDDE